MVLVVHTGCRPAGAVAGAPNMVHGPGGGELIPGRCDISQ